MLIAHRHALSPLAPRSTRDDLAAEPAAARLREKCPYWFDVGLSLAAQCAGEAAFVGLAPVVASAFRGRYKALLARAHTAVDAEDKLAFLRLLTREERHGASLTRRRRMSHFRAPQAHAPLPRARAVFNAGRASMLAFQAWRYNTDERMEAPPIVRALQRRRQGSAAQLAAA